jgi:predicted dehydrogenase
MSINWGIIGCGKIAHKFIQDFEFVKKGKVVAVAARSQERAKAFADQYAVPKSYGSYEALVNDAEVDVIYIATPHNYHLEHMKLCFNHNKAVLCEKPITVNAKDFEEALGVLKTKDVFLMEAMWTWYLPAVIKAKQWIQEGRIGEVKFLRADFGFKGEMDMESRLFNPDLAAGSLLDIGIYPLSIAEFLIDSEIKSVKSVGYLGRTGIDEYNAISMEYENGVFVQASSTILADTHNDAFIVGTEGMIRIKHFWCTKSAILETRTGTEIFEDDCPSHGYNWETEAVNELLMAGKKESPVVTHAKTMKTMKLMDLIRKEMGLKYPFE